jgi:hypothetical protein
MKGTDRYQVEGVTCMCGGDRLTVVNMSVGGLFLASDGMPPPTGQDLPLEVLLPGRAQGLTVTARVSWINERENPRLPRLPPGFGVKIVRVGFREKMELLHFLREMDPVSLRRR